MLTEQSRQEQSYNRMEKSSNQLDDDVKRYYIKGEFYDWVTQPKRLEKVFHAKREKILRTLLAEHCKGSIALDVGCGTGLITRHLEAAQVLGLDINCWNLKRAKTHAPRIEPIVGDATELPIRSSSIDVVICTETLEHLLNPHHAISEFVRILKDGGRIIGSVPQKSLIWNYRKLFLTTCPVSEPFHRNYTINELDALLESQDIKIITIFKAVFGLTLFFVAEKSPSNKF